MPFNCERNTIAGMSSLSFNGFSALARALSLPVGSMCAVMSSIAYATGICGPAAAAAAGLVPFLGFLASLFLRFHKVIRSYVEKSLADDLLDIKKFYMSNPQSHFFVAVGAGCDGNNAAESVLGCVALEYKPDDKTYAGWGELRRMSVAKAGRRRGIASQLNNAVLAHAEAQKLKGVFLVLSFRFFSRTTVQILTPEELQTTSTLQPVAISMYRKFGYEKVNTGAHLLCSLALLVLKYLLTGKKVQIFDTRRAGSFYSYPFVKDAVCFFTFAMTLPRGS